MVFYKSKNYGHDCIAFPKAKYNDRPIAIAGGSGSGKTVTGMRYVETLFEKEGYNVFILTDIKDEYEPSFAIFPASEGKHLWKLGKQLEMPEGKPVIIHAPVSAEVLKKEMKRVKKQFKIDKLPEIDFFTVGIKNLGREEAEFLMETTADKESIGIMLDCINRLKNDDGLYELKRLINEKTKKKKETYYGKEIPSEFDEVLGTATSTKEIGRKLLLLERSKLIMPQSFNMNFDIQKLLNKRAYHTFTYQFLPQDKILRQFMIDYILSEIGRNISYSKYPVVVFLDEMDVYAPFSAKGYKDVFCMHCGQERMNQWRSRGKGTTIIFVMHEYTKTSYEIRSICTERKIHKLEIDDLITLSKAKRYNKKVIDTISTLKTGQYVNEGREHMIFDAKMPKHGHKHGRQKFIEEYFKYYPDRMVDYNSLVEKLEAFYKEYDKSVKEKRQHEIRKFKDRIMKQQKRKFDKEKKSDKLEELREKERERKVELDKLRDDTIIEVYELFLREGKKTSSRKIEAEVNRRGIKCSYKTVTKVLKRVGKIE